MILPTVKVMKSIFMIQFLLFLPSLLLFGFFICPAFASPGPEAVDTYRDVRSKRTTKHHHRRNDTDIEDWALGKFPGDFSNSEAQETPLGWEFTGCDVNSTSPIYADVLSAAANGIADKGDKSCIPKHSNVTHCALIAADTTAKIYFCGEPGIEISCSNMNSIVLALGGNCVKDIGGTARVRGTVALFPGGAPLNYAKLSFVTIVAVNDGFPGDL